MAGERQPQDDLERMEQALGAAADAGDVEGARHLASEMRRMLRVVNPALGAPVDATAEGAKLAARETGAGEAAMVGAGRTVDKVAAGVKQSFLSLPSYPLTAPANEKAKTDLAASEANKDAAYAALQKERPFSTAGGEALPYVALPASAGVLPAAAAVATTEGAKYGTPGERVGRATMGGLTTAGGGLLAKAGASFLAPVTAKAAGGAHQGALEAAERIGMQPTLGEATGSTFVRRLEDLVSRLPGGGAVMAEHQAGNATALNRAAARAIGETADDLTPEVFANASKRIGQVFEDIKTLPGKQIQVGPNVAAAADDILRQQAKMLPTQQDAQLIKIANDAKAAALNRGRIDGETYQLTRSGLSDAAFDATGTNKRLYGALLNALDDSADASLRAAGNTALADALKTARPQYANLKILEKGATAEAGDVSAAKVASTMRTNNPGAFRRGQFVGSEMGDIAAVGEGLKPLRAGSPTFERDVMANPLTAAFHWLWSKPTAAALTSPAATIYPRTLGNTALARKGAEALQPVGRAGVAAALQQSGVVPFLPVRAE